MASVKTIAAKDAVAVLPEGIMLFVGGDGNDRRHMMQRVLRNDAGRANKLVVCLTDAQESRQAWSAECGQSVELPHPGFCSWATAMQSVYDRQPIYTRGKQMIVIVEDDVNLHLEEFALLHKMEHNTALISVQSMLKQLPFWLRPTTVVAMHTPELPETKEMFRLFFQHCKQLQLAGFRKQLQANAGLVCDMHGVFDPAVHLKQAFAQCMVLAPDASERTSKLQQLWQMWRMQHDDHQEVLCFAGTEEAQRRWSECLPRRCIRDEANIVFGMETDGQIERKVKCLRRARSQTHAYKPRELPFRALPAQPVVLDLANGQQLEHSDLRALILDARIFNFMVMLGGDASGLCLPPMLRSSMDIVLACYTPVVEEQERMYRHFFGCFETFAEFQEMLQRHGWLAVDNSCCSGGVLSFPGRAAEMLGRTK